MRQDSKTFSIEKSNPRIPSKNSSFSTGFVDWIPQSKKLGSEKLFFNSIRKPDFVSNRKPAFSIHFSDCIRIRLRPFLLCKICLVSNMDPFPHSVCDFIVEDWTYVNLVFVERV